MRKEGRATLEAASESDADSTYWQAHPVHFLLRLRDGADVKDGAPNNSDAGAKWRGH